MVLIACLIFFGSLILIALELFEKSIVSILGAVLMILCGVITTRESFDAINFEVLLLLSSMMILMNIASKSGFFSWLNVQIATLTKGNPILIFLLFSSLTGIFSSFLANVTTIMLMIPITIALVQGTGKDPKMYVIGVIIFANLGGAISLIGDPTNIIVGMASGLTFNNFILNLSIPVLISTILITILIFALNKKTFQPINTDARRLFLSHLLIERVKYKFLKQNLDISFILKVLAVLILTLLSFIFSSSIDLSLAFIALLGALILLFLTEKQVPTEEVFKNIEWNTLFFFAGLFIMVAGLEEVGVLKVLAKSIISISKDPIVLVLIILWSAALVSMVVDNIPFVTIMVPIIQTIQYHFPHHLDANLLWWALCLGACLGGFGSLLGSSANIVAVDISKKEGVPISFFEYMKVGAPFAFLSLIIASIYLIVRLKFVF